MTTPSPTPTFSTKSPTIRRILAEARELSTHPDPSLHAAPLDTNLFEWHFTLLGPPAPPTLLECTTAASSSPLLPLTGHHEETWQPAWGIRTALWALRAFMEGDAKGQVGGMEMGESQRRELAGESRGWVCGGCGGRSNERILSEEGGGGDGGEGEGEAHKIPEELRFGFKDEMGKEPGEKVDKGKGKEVVEAPGTGQEEAIKAKNAEMLAAVPATTVPAAPRLNNAVPVVARTSTDGVPVWVDKAITGVIAALALLIIKKILV
ncbi:uncharacterized protein KY384_004797 [Bacidia gigantensis]|uniref:uncharacterized protein n=1 Tax=Bacidia gigantensis TaxID=2732470 RepID=UPI001D04932F|nr:uncharacterized protein KY384_004797 [Bacidia gigantensis]KAG8530295.1 hypothetical protein KY384_004797 [Bacidia gigantensis]